MTAFAPIIITILVLITLMGIVIGIRSILSRSSFTFSIKRNFLFGYLGVIVFLSFLMVIFLLPKIELEVMGEEKSIPDIYSMVLDGSPQDDLPEQFIKKEWSMTPESDVINLKVESGEDGSLYTSIVVEENDDSNIHLTLYETPTLVRDINISDEIPLNKIAVENDEEILIDKGQKRIELKFYNIANDMIYNQFTDSPNRNWQHEIFNFEVGEQLLYITIPKGMTIESEIEDYIYYVND